MKHLADRVDDAVHCLEQEMRGASYLAAPPDLIDLLDAIGTASPEKEYADFKIGILRCADFRPAPFRGSTFDSGRRIGVHLVYLDQGVEMNVEVEPHGKYGSKMTMHWKPLEPSEVTPDTGTWQWQDLNCVSRIVIGYAVMTSMDRFCFDRWEFLR